MKKLIALAFVCAFAFAFVACGGGAKNDETSADTTAATAPAPADTTGTDTTKTDTTKAQ
jgi:hypothetical protein